MLLMMLLLLDLSFRLGVEVAVGGGVFGTTLIFGFCVSGVGLVGHDLRRR